MYNESSKDFIVADLSLFAFENVLNIESLITQLESSNTDFILEIPKSIFDMINYSESTFQSILRDINPNVSETHLNRITRFLSENSNIIPRYELGCDKDFDAIPEELMRVIVGKIFRRAPDRINKNHILYYYQILHALEIGKANSPLVRRKLLGFVKNFKEGITDKTDLLHNATLSILDSLKRGIIFCRDGLHSTGETLFNQSKSIYAASKEIENKVQEEIQIYSDKKKKLIHFYFRTKKRSILKGAGIITFGASIANIFAQSNNMTTILATLLAFEGFAKGILFVVNGD